MFCLEADPSIQLKGIFFALQPIQGSERDLIDVTLYLTERYVASIDIPIPLYQCHNSSESTSSLCLLKLVNHWKKCFSSFHLFLRNSCSFSRDICIYILVNNTNEENNDSSKQKINHMENYYSNTSQLPILFLLIRRVPLTFIPSMALYCLASV